MVEYEDALCESLVQVSNIRATRTPSVWDFAIKSEGARAVDVSILDAEGYKIGAGYESGASYKWKTNDAKLSYSGKPSKILVGCYY